jgi:hypothetical protein
LLECASCGGKILARPPPAARSLSGRARRARHARTTGTGGFRSE